MIQWLGTETSFQQQCGWAILEADDYTFEFQITSALTNHILPAASHETLSQKYPAPRVSNLPEIVWNKIAVLSCQILE